MTQPTPPLVVIAVDSLDWQLLQQLSDDGDMPFCQKLIENGASGQMNIPPPHSSAAIWSTVSTGVLADQHGVCHDLEIRDDGLTVQSFSAQGIHALPFWQAAMASGKTVKVAGWPTTMGTNIPSSAIGSCIVSNGVEKAQPGGELCWPLAPQAISPTSARDKILELLVHPHDLDNHMVLSLLTKHCQEAGLAKLAAGGLAEIASLHNIGTCWAEQDDWDLLTLRFSFLPLWVTAIQKHGIELRRALKPWYSYLDLMIGRYMALAGQEANLVVISDHGLAPTQSNQAEELLGIKARGSIIMCGPDVASDKLLNHCSGLDVCPTLLTLLNLPTPPGLKGKNILASFKPALDANITSIEGVSLNDIIKTPKTDSASLSWLEKQGYSPINLTPLTKVVDKVKAETMAGWAEVKYATGNKSQASEALQQALALQPQNLGLRLSLANKLLETGQVEKCRALVEGLPPAAHEGDWPGVVSSLIAFADKNWAVAEQHLLSLVQSGTCPINALGWLGHLKFAQQKWLEATQFYEQAIGRSGELSGYYVGLGNAQLQLNNPQLALTAFSNAIALHPLNANYLVSRAQAYQKLNNLQLAQQDLWRALSIDASLTDAQRLLAKLVVD